MMKNAFKGGTLNPRLRGYFYMNLSIGRALATLLPPLVYNIPFVPQRLISDSERDFPAKFISVIVSSFFVALVFKKKKKNCRKRLL